MDIVKENLDKVFSNKYTSSLLSLFLVLYGGLAAPKLPKKVLELFNKDIVKIVILALIVYSSQKDTRLSIMIAVVLLITMNTLSNREMFEGFSGSDCGNHLTREDCNADGHCMYDDNGMCVAADSMTNVSYEDFTQTDYVQFNNQRECEGAGGAWDNDLGVCNAPETMTNSSYEDFTESDCEITGTCNVASCTPVIAYARFLKQKLGTGNSVNLMFEKITEPNIGDETKSQFEASLNTLVTSVTGDIGNLTHINNLKNKLQTLVSHIESNAGSKAAIEGNGNHLATFNALKKYIGNTTCCFKKQIETIKQNLGDSAEGTQVIDGVTLSNVTIAIGTGDCRTALDALDS
jgi:multisubunit Na+/H+ antiporter MnhF subunit